MNAVNEKMASDQLHAVSRRKNSEAAMGAPVGGVSELIPDSPEAQLLVAKERIKQLEALLAMEGWRPISEAPKDTTPVDLFVPGYKGRLTDMRRVAKDKTNVYYECIAAGYTCIRDATHFRLVPGAPDLA